MAFDPGQDSTDHPRVSQDASLESIQGIRAMLLQTLYTNFRHRLISRVQMASPADFFEFCRLSRFVEDYVHPSEHVWRSLQ